MSALLCDWSRTQDSNLHLPAPKAGGLPIIPIRVVLMEVRVGFEPTVELLCRQLPWTTRPPHYDWLPGRDSNPHKRFWRPLCCHYTTEKCLADRSGIEPDSHGLTVRPHTVVRFGQYMVPSERFELPTPRLQGESSTTELQGHDLAVPRGNDPLLPA